jgi:thiamine-monophosphate kinase
MARTPTSRAIPSELALIETLRSRVAKTRHGRRELRAGIGDDCAVLRPRRGYEICVTTDFSLEGVHFRRDWHPPEAVGHRCLARGLSDLAAMGAEPLGVFLSLALPARIAATWVDRFLDGFLALAADHRVALAGGDTAQSPGPIAADIVAVGQVPAGQALLRSGARAGDVLYVTGALGGAAAELRALERDPQRFRRIRNAGDGHPHLYPQPRLAVGRRLRKLAHAMIDLSDGLSTDLTHLCRETRVAATLDETALPIHALAAKHPDALRLALHGGEDYELLFAAAPGARIPARIAHVPVHRIGVLRARRSRDSEWIQLRGTNGTTRPLQAGGWEHFHR